MVSFTNALRAIVVAVTASTATAQWNADHANLGKDPNCPRDLPWGTVATVFNDYDTSWGGISRDLYVWNASCEWIANIGRSDLSYGTTYSLYSPLPYTIEFTPQPDGQSSFWYAGRQYTSPWQLKDLTKGNDKAKIWYLTWQP